MSKQRNILIRAWEPEAQAFIREQSITIEFAVGDRLYADEETYTHSIFPQSGLLGELATYEPGKSLEMRSVGREGFVGIPLPFAGVQTEGDVTGLISGTATLIPADRLSQAYALFPSVAQSLGVYGRFTIHTLMQSIAYIRSQNAEQLIALWLLIVGDKLRSPHIPITHETLSNLLGMRRATVTTTLSKLTQNGILETGRGTIHILNHDRLKVHGGPYYRKWREAFEKMKQPLSAITPPDR